MNQEQVTGRVKKVAGRVEDAAGALVGNPRAQVRGKARAAGGQAEALYGDVLNTVEAMVVDRPWAALAASAFIGFLLGMRVAGR